MRRPLSGNATDRIGAGTTNVVGQGPEAKTTDNGNWTRHAAKAESAQRAGCAVRAGQAVRVRLATRVTHVPKTRCEARARDAMRRRTNLVGSRVGLVAVSFCPVTAMSS